MKKVQSEISSNVKVSVLGAIAAAALVIAPAASAHGDRGYSNGPEVSGRVEIVREVPGGTVSVGVEVGRPRPQVVVVEPQPRVVVVEERQPRVVVVKQEERCGGHDREVTVIRKSPDRTVIIKRDGYGRPVKEVVVYKDGHDHDYDKHHGKHHGKHGNGHGKGHGKGHDKGHNHGRGHGHDHDHDSYKEVRDGQSRYVYVRN